MPLLTSLLTGIELPFLHRVTRHIPDDGLSDIPRSVRDALNASGVAERLLPNGEVAIGVGSRGIAGLPQIVRATVDWFRERGARPFLVPCMGSHGGATAEGQLRVLEHLGVTAASAGCPIRAGMDTIVIGTLDNGLPVHMDTHATSADGVFVINRVKPHTAFTGPHESGLVKMLVIGLGKRNGADCCHSLGFGRFAEVMPQMARLLLERKPSCSGDWPWSRTRMIGFASLKPSSRNDCWNVTKPCLLKLVPGWGRSPWTIWMSFSSTAWARTFPVRAWTPILPDVHQVPTRQAGSRPHGSASCD